MKNSEGKVVGTSRNEKNAGSGHPSGGKMIAPAGHSITEIDLPKEMEGMKAGELHKALANS